MEHSATQPTWHEDGLSCSLTISPIPNFSESSLSVVMKRFAGNKLLVVITDGQKFGNVIITSEV